MKRTLLFAPLLLALGLPSCDPSTVLFAQTLPANLGGLWNPNPASDNVVDYRIWLDGVVVATIPASMCTPTQCTGRYDVPTFGNHSLTVTARNLRVSVLPDLQESAPSAATAFRLNQAPQTAPAAVSITP